MSHKAKMLIAFFSFSALMSSSSFAHLPLSYNDMLQYERDRMVNSYQQEGGSYEANQPTDEKWLTSTPATWGYMINAEHLRMKQSRPAYDQSQPARKADINTMPTTWNDAVQQQYQQMKHHEESRP